MPSDCRPRILANPGFVQYFSPVDQFPLSEKVYDGASFRLLPAEQIAGSRRFTRMALPQYESASTRALMTGNGIIGSAANPSP